MSYSHKKPLEQNLAWGSAPLAVYTSLWGPSQARTFPRVPWYEGLAHRASVRSEAACGSLCVSALGGRASPQLLPRGARRGGRPTGFLPARVSQPQPLTSQAGSVSAGWRGGGCSGPCRVFGGLPPRCQRPPPTSTATTRHVCRTRQTSSAGNLLASVHVHAVRRLQCRS